MQRAISLLLLCALCTPAVGIEIVEFCPDPYLADDVDEYIVLSGSGSLDGVMVTDGEGGFRFPPGKRIDGLMTVARNAAAFSRMHGTIPEYELYDFSPDVPQVIRGGDLRMSNTGDELFLYVDDRLVQTVSWPRDVRPREGQVHYLDSGLWDARPLLLGQSRLRAETYQNVSLALYAAPDAALEVATTVIDLADREILANVYEFTSWELAQTLANASRRGVAVTVLLEGGPVGGVSSSERSMCTLMNESGIPVYQMAGTTDMPARYRFDHAKYLVIDRRGVLVTSENFKESGFPPQGSRGNRGWGVYIEDPRVAGYFAEVFAGDFGGRDIVAMDTKTGVYLPQASDPYRPVFVPMRIDDASITPVIAPDTSYLIEELIESASESIEVEQAYITNVSAYELHPFLAAAINASRRGVAVRVLLDATWYNIEDERDNDEMAACINRIARTEGLPLTARCGRPAAEGGLQIHNKGVIVDGRHVLVSSINWNDNSPNFNREAGVIVSHSAAGEYFSRIFEADWEAAAAATRPVPVDWWKIAFAIAVIVLLIALYLRRRR